MFQACSPFLSFPLVHSLPENQIAALKGKGNSQNSQKRPQRKFTLTAQQTTQHLRCDRTGTKVVTCLSLPSQLHQLMFCDKKADTHTFFHTEFVTSWTQNLTTSKEWVCPLSMPSHVPLSCWGWAQALQCFAFSGCRFGICPLFPSRKRGKTDCQSNWSCLRHKGNCVHFMIPGGRDLASSASQGYCHTHHTAHSSGHPLFSTQETGCRTQLHSSCTGGREE